MPPGRCGPTARPGDPFPARCRRRPRCGYGTARATSTGRRPLQGPPRRASATALCGAARADLRLPQLQERSARPVLCGDRAQGQRVRAHGRHGAQAAASARHPQLGAPLRRELAGRPLQPRAGHQRLRRAAGDPVARLQARPGGARASSRGRGAITLPCPPFWPRPPPSGRPAPPSPAWSASSTAIRGTWWRRRSRGSAAPCRSEILSDLPDCTSCRETLPPLYSS